MSNYSQYPKIWTPLMERQDLLTVKTPANCLQLNFPAYQTLMQERLVWMMAEWMATYDHSLEETPRELIRFTAQTALTQFTPHLPENPEDETEMEVWREEWAEAIVLGNDFVRERLTLVELPASPIEQSDSQYNGLLERHNEIQLSEWLSAATI
ncbi:MAG: hypothetical protein AAFN12_15365 [Cyanobacteria bacterium J06560_2]